MRAIPFFFVLGACMLIGVIAAATVYRTWYVIGVHDTSFDIEIVTEPSIGFVADRDAIHFGKTVAGGGGTRDTILASKVRAWATITSDSGWISATPARVLVEPDEPVHASIAIDVPEGTPVGNYSGRIRVRYTRVLPWT